MPKIPATPQEGITDTVRQVQRADFFFQISFGSIRQVLGGQRHWSVREEGLRASHRDIGFQPTWTRVPEKIKSDSGKTVRVFMRGGMSEAVYNF